VKLFRQMACVARRAIACNSAAFNLVFALLEIVLLPDNGLAMPKAPDLEGGVIVSFSEIFNRPATIEGPRGILAQYNREAVLLVLAKLGAALRIWFRPDYEKDNGLARDVFKNAARAEAHAMQGRPRRLFFTRLGVLATARLALSACDNARGSQNRSAGSSSPGHGVLPDDE
jgi:hypothetical protein